LAIRSFFHVIHTTWLSHILLWVHSAATETKRDTLRMSTPPPSYSITNLWKNVFNKDCSQKFLFHPSASACLSSKAQTGRGEICLVCQPNTTAMWGWLKAIRSLSKTYFICQMEVGSQKEAQLVLHYHRILPSCRTLSAEEEICGLLHHLEQHTS
jgi:hypothetical protein